jgi:hypothetical protein
MTTNKRTKKISDRFGMVARVALLAMTASVFTAGYAMAEQGANSPQTTVQPKQQPKKQTQQQNKQPQQQLQTNQAPKQTQQQQNALKAQQQQNAQQQANQAAKQQQLQQQKQAEQGQQLLKQQQQKQAEQQQRLKDQQQQQQKQVQQQQLKEQQQKQAAQQQQLKQQQQNQQQLFKQQQNQAKQQAEFQRYDWNTYRPGQRPPLWAQYRQNFDPHPYQWARNAPRQYNVRYIAPPGWRYQRWDYGQVYPRPYWQQQTYWLNNYQQYGLEPLPYGYVWVQNGPDALAVDSFTGTILQVIYGLFAGGGGLL